MTLLAAFVSAAILPAAVSADETIQVTPAHFSLAIAPGDSTSETVMIRNLSTSQLKVNARSGMDVAADQPAVKVDPDQVLLAPGDSATIRVAVQVPSGSAPGNTRAAVDLVAVPDDASEVAIIGQVEVGIDIEIFQPVADVQWTWPRLIDSGDRAVFSIKGRNAGKAPARLDATVNMRGLPFGGAQLKMASQDLAVGQEGEMETAWDDRPLFGLEWTTLSVTTGAGSPVEQKTLIIVFPWKIALALASVALAAAVFLHYRHGRRSSR